MLADDLWSASNYSQWWTNTICLLVSVTGCVSIISPGEQSCRVEDEGELRGDVDECGE
jgi:hypothetical protein